MNEDELKRNTVLTDYSVKDLNEDPTLPYEDATFDVRGQLHLLPMQCCAAAWVSLLRWTALSLCLPSPCNTALQGLLGVRACPA